MYCCSAAPQQEPGEVDDTQVEVHNDTDARPVEFPPEPSVHQKLDPAEEVEELKEPAMVSVASRPPGTFTVRATRPARGKWGLNFAACGPRLVITMVEAGTSAVATYNASVQEDLTIQVNVNDAILAANAYATSEKIDQVFKDPDLAWMELLLAHPNQLQLTLEGHQGSMGIEVFEVTYARRLSLHVGQVYPGNYIALRNSTVSSDEQLLPGDVIVSVNDTSDVKQMKEMMKDAAVATLTLQVIRYPSLDA